MKMVSHIFVNSRVADMFIELIFNNSSSMEETVRHQPQSGERFYKLPLELGRTLGMRFITHYMSLL